MAENKRAAPKPQSLRDLQRQIKEDAERWREHPLVREEIPKLRRLAEALRMKPQPPQPSAPPSKQKRRKGRGRPGKLSADTIARLRGAYQKRLKAKPKFAVGERAYKFLRELLPESERGVSDRTLYRYIIKPVRNDKNPALTK